MTQRYQYCSRSTVKALVAALRCAVLLSVFDLVYNQSMERKEEKRLDARIVIDIIPIIISCFALVVSGITLCVNYYFKGFGWHIRTVFSLYKVKWRVFQF